MNVLLIALGSAGDVHPLVGIGHALAGRGHRVTVATNPYFEALLRRVGLDFVPLGTADEFAAVMANPDLWHTLRGFHLLVRELILQQLEPLYALVEQFAARPSPVVVAPVTALGARVAHEKLGVPLVTVHLQPMMLRSMHLSAVAPPLALAPGVPRWFKRLQVSLADRLLIDRAINRGLTPFRARLGLPPVRRLADGWWDSPQSVLGLFPDWFAPPQPDWPRQAVLSGFPLWDERGFTPAPDHLEPFLADGEPPIVFTPGSAMQHGRAFFVAAVDACRRLGRRGVLLTRFAEQLPPRLPESVRHCDFVPLGSLLARSAAIVHHGGIGTSAQGLAAGIPQVIMPMAYDQPDNAARLARLGVSATLPPRAFRGDRLAAVLERLLASTSVSQRCGALAARCDTSAALEQSCQVIEDAGAAR